MRWLRKAASVLLPWPARSERRALIAEATAEKERSQASAARAKTLEWDIRRLAAENHWADAVARTLRNGRGA